MLSMDGSFQRDFKTYKNHALQQKRNKEKKIQRENGERKPEIKVICRSF